MLANLIGTFDFPSMLVVVAFVAGGTAIAVALLARKRHADYQIQAKELENKHSETMANIEANAIVDRAKLQQNLITSHKSEDN